MIGNLNYKYMIDLVTNLHLFIDEAETAIKQIYSQFNSSKVQLSARQSQEIRTLTAQYNSQQSGVRSKAQKIIADAQGIYNEILKLEETLSQSDKYYVKARAKREQELADKVTDKYDKSRDYFETLNDIKERFQSLVVKYSGRKHKGLLDGMNYLMSSKRKQDYDEIIILKNTIKKLIAEINDTLPALTDDSLNSADQNFLKQRETLLRKHEAERQRVQVQFNTNIESLADNICAKLDGIISDELVDELSSAMADYDLNYGKIDARRLQFGNFIILGYLVYPYAEMTESSIVRQLISSKCEKLIVGNEIRLPVMCSLNSGFNWAIDINDVTSTNVEKFTHSVIFSLLSFSPVAKINFSIFDIENRGNSVLPFLELKKKVPEMFYGKVITTTEEIRARLYNLNNYIDDFIQNKLGNSYENIFEYNANSSGDIAPVTFLIIYDFPKGFDEANLAELKNIMKNGNKCGIFTLICNNKNIEQTGYRDITHNVNAVLEKCTQIKYANEGFWLNGLELAVKSIPSNHEVNEFANKYVLILEGQKNKGMVLPSLVKKLMEAKEGEELNHYINYILQLKQNYENCYGKGHEGHVDFPKSVMLGSVGYPVELFSPQAVEGCMDKGFTVSGTESRYISIPFTCELDDSFNIFIQNDGDNSDKILTLSHIMMLSFLSSLPYGNIKISVIDTEKRGNSIIPYLDFRKKAPDIFDEQIYTTQEAVSKKLQKLNNFIDEFIQDKLGNKFSDFVEYNVNTVSDRQPVQLLLIYDYPKEFDGKMHEQLLNILKNGNKCGIYTIISYNPHVSMSHYNNHENYLEQIKKKSICLDCKDNKILLAPYNLPLTVNEMISNSEVSEFADNYVTRLNSAKTKGLSFKDILAKEMFSCSSAKSLSIPMGVGSGNSIVNLVMGEGSSHHGLIAGATGSGKSTLLHTIIMSAMLNYSPEQLNLYLMDFKSGTEFKIYESVKLPHIKLLALDAMQEFGESILENLVAEMTSRGELFKSVGQTSLKGYAESTGKSLPRILVIMDEFQILFNDSTNRKIAMNCAELTKRIVTEGRAFGIHLLMATQSTKVIRDLTLQQGTIEQMRIRIGLKCGEDDARYLFTDRNDIKALEMMKGSIGTAVLNPEYSEASNIGFKTAYCDKETQKSYLDLIASTYKDLDAKPQIFEGNRTVKMVDHLQENGIVKYENIVTRIFFGNKIKVAPPFTLDVDRRRKHNMLICGTNEKMCENLINQYIISALLNDRNSIYCIDGDVIVGDNSSGEIYDIFEKSEKFSLAKDRGEIITFVHQIFDKFKQTKASGSDTNTFVIVKNLQWLDIVQKMLKDEYINESDYLQTTSEPETSSDEPFDWGLSDTPTSTESVSEQLRKMIDEGSSCGIYFIFGCNEYAVVKEAMYFADNILSKIPERIVFALSNNDADNLIDGVSVSQMKDNTVYFTDSVRNTFQFQPYVISSVEDVKKILERE